MLDSTVFDLHVGHCRLLKKSGKFRLCQLEIVFICFVPAVSRNVTF